MSDEYSLEDNLLMLRSSIAWKRVVTVTVSWVVKGTSVVTRVMVRSSVTVSVGAKVRAWLEMGSALVLVLALVLGLRSSIAWKRVLAVADPNPNAKLLRGQRYVC